MVRLARGRWATWEAAAPDWGDLLFVMDTLVALLLEVMPMLPTDMPLWLSAMQAVTWLVTRDPRLTMRALGRGGHDDLALRGAGDTSTPELPPDQTGLSAADRAGLAGDPDDWGGVTLPWLAIRQGDAEAPRRAVRDLMIAVRAGKVDSLMIHGEFPAHGWSRLTLRETDIGDGFVVELRDAPSVSGRHAVAVFARDDLMREWSAFEDVSVAVVTGGVERVASNIAAETRFENWLTNRMRANPDNPPGKAAIKAEAERVGHSVSERAFLRVFANAVKAAGAPAWSAPGRKSKRRIETAD